MFPDQIAVVLEVQVTVIEKIVPGTGRRFHPKQATGDAVLRWPVRVEARKPKRRPNSETRQRELEIGVESEFGVGVE